jgi:hypothetical protein
VNAKKMILAAAAALMVLLAAGVAYATGSGGDSSEQSTGTGMEKAKSVALDHVNGRVTATEFRDEEGYYEVEVTKGDGPSRPPLQRPWHAGRQRRLRRQRRTQRQQRQRRLSPRA